MIRAIIFLAGVLIAGSALACPPYAALSSSGSEQGAALYAECELLAEFDIHSGRGPVPVEVFGVPSTDPIHLQLVWDGLVDAGLKLKDFTPLTADPVQVFISPTPRVGGGEVLASAKRLRVAGAPKIGRAHV